MIRIYSMVSHILVIHSQNQQYKCLVFHHDFRLFNNVGLLQSLCSDTDEHASPGTSKLTELPVEILQDIVSLLPLSSAASFTFCSPYTREVLGTQY